MEEDPGLRFSWQHFDWNSSEGSKQNMRFNLGNPNIGFPFSNNNHASISTHHLLPFDGFPGLTHPRMDQSGEHLDWFYGLPHYHRAFALKDGLSVNPCGTYVNTGKPYEGVDVSGLPKLFMFHQSGDQAILSFGPETNRVPFMHRPMAMPQQLEITVTGDESQGGKTTSKGQDEDEDVDVHSVMHEDTEELNALLYSDEESDYLCDGDDDEVTSTGHSPSTMTGHCDHGYSPSRKDFEEVASSLWPLSKKRKLMNECHDLLPSADSNSDENLTGNFDSDNATSSSGDRKKISQNRAIKRARICETVSVLQSLVPGMKEKDPVVILDEAIKYLKSLKVKAAALGLGQI